MRVILLQDVKKIGQKGQIVNVKDGYGRNFLIPRGLAVEADEGSMRQLQHQQNVIQEKKDRQMSEAQRIKEKLEDIQVIIEAKTGEKGRLFGSINAGDIAEAIEKSARVEVDKRKIELDEPIKNLGEYQVSIRLYTGITAQVRVVVKGA
jgi:large subunit ribosomal protein L9